MAKLLYQVRWDRKAKKVLPTVPTYQVLQVEPKDKIQAFTKDPKPFIVAISDLRLAKRLGLQKAKNADGRNDLYQVPTALPPSGPRKKPQTLTCGTLVNGHFVEWGPGFPLDN